MLNMYVFNEKNTTTFALINFVKPVNNSRLHVCSRTVGIFSVALFWQRIALSQCTFTVQSCFLFTTSLHWILHERCRGGLFFSQSCLNYMCMLLQVSACYQESKSQDATGAPDMVTDEVRHVSELWVTGYWSSRLKLVLSKPKAFETIPIVTTASNAYRYQV